MTTTYGGREFTTLNDPIPISPVNLTVVKPQQGATPANATKTSDAFSVQSTTWKKKSDDSTISTSTTFGGLQQYYVEILLKANAGFTFAGLTQANAIISWGTGTADRGQATLSDTLGEFATLSYTFPETKKVAAIYFVQQTQKMAYLHNDPLDLTGLVVKVGYELDPVQSENIPAADFAKWGLSTYGGSAGNTLLPEVLNLSTSSALIDNPITIKFFSDSSVDSVRTTANITISKKNIGTASSITIEIPAHIYMGGSPVVPVAGVVSVKDGTTSLVSGTDYTALSGASFTNNENAGTATVTINAIGNYEGTKTGTFTINKRDISTSATVTVSGSYSYDGTAKAPTTVVVALASESKTDPVQSLPAVPTLADTNYTLSYGEYNTNVNGSDPDKQPTVIVTGTGNYTGSKSGTFTIAKGVLSKVDDFFTVVGLASSGFALSPYKDFTYDGTEKEVTVSVKSPWTGVGDRTISYEKYAAPPATTSTPISGKPKDVGSYKVLLSTAVGDNFAALTPAVDIGKLTIQPRAPSKADFAEITQLAYDGTQRPVNVTVNTGITGMGRIINVRYTYPGSNTAQTEVPRDVGEYPITVYVEAGDNYLPDPNLVVGSLVIKKKTPVFDDFTINGASSGGVVERPYTGSPQAVFISLKEPMREAGAITVKYTDTTNLIETTTAPSAIGEYFITFDVAGGSNFESGTNLGLELGVNQARLKIVPAP